MQEDSVPLLSLVREPSSFGPVPGKVSSEESGPLRGTRKPCSAARPSDDTDCHILLLPFQVLPFYSHTPPHTHCHRTINIRNALGLQISNMNLEVGEVGRGTACGGGAVKCHPASYASEEEEFSLTDAAVPYLVV